MNRRSFIAKALIAAPGIGLAVRTLSGASERAAEYVNDHRCHATLMIGASVMDVLNHELPGINNRISLLNDGQPFVIICHNDWDSSKLLHAIPCYKHYDRNHYHLISHQYCYNGDGRNVSHIDLRDGTRLKFMNYEQDITTFEGFEADLVILAGSPPPELVRLMGYRTLVRQGKVILI